MRETEKTIELEGRTFILTKLPAASAYTTLVVLLTKGLPVNIIGTVLEQFVPANMLAHVGKQNMSEEEMEHIQTRLVSKVYEVLPAGRTPVMDSMGHYQVEDLEYNMVLFGELFAEMLKFQYGDFFTEALGRIGVKLGDENALKTKAMNTLLSAVDR